MNREHLITVASITAGVATILGNRTSYSSDPTAASVPLRRGSAGRSRCQSPL